MRASHQNSGMRFATFLHVRTRFSSSDCCKIFWRTSAGRQSRVGDSLATGAASVPDDRAFEVDRGMVEFEEGLENVLSSCILFRDDIAKLRAMLADKRLTC